MEAVYSDLTNYIQKNIFPSRTVLIFPPFNGFRRFLIHKLIEDNFASSEVAAFSIGEDITRRIVVCYKGLIRENKSLPSLPSSSANNMIEKEKPLRQKSSTDAAVYKPPAARLADSKKSKDAAKSSDSKRVRRPDQQMYVPRPKRASYDNEQPRSRHHSSSRTSLDSSSSDEKIKSIDEKNEESRLCESNNATSLSESSKLLSQNETTASPQVDSSKEDSQLSNLNLNLKSTTSGDCNICFTLVSPATSKGNLISVIPVPEELSDGLGSQLNETSCKILPDELSNRLRSQLDETSCKNDCSGGQLHTEMEIDSCNCDAKVMKKFKSSSYEEDCLVNNSKNRGSFTSKDTLIKSPNEESSAEIIQNIKTDSREELTCSKVEHMETISISSESTGGSSSSGITSSSDSKNSSSSSSDSENVKRHYKYNIDDKAHIETSSSQDSKEQTNSAGSANNSQLQNLESVSLHSALPVSSEVLVISDTSSSSDSITMSTTEKETVCHIKEVKKPRVSKGSKREKLVKKSRVVDPVECDWESLYDDSGECLVPSLMEELTNSVGKVRIASVDNDYRAYQSVEERTNDGECIIEIYDFPAEFKTTDLFNIFAAYRNRNLQIKWVDDTHALGVFPCPLIADEVLACTLPFVKTRPLRLGIAESRIKARNLVLPVLPPMERPKTCPALARRLVSGALGLRLPTTSQEREKEKQMLKEAREKRRLEAKQRDAAWNGTLTSDNSC